MGGIAGKFSLNGCPVDEALIAGMVRLLSHRGPDGEGIYTSGPIGLASRRLSIIDSDTDRQPIANEDGSVRVVLNGEIYNFLELRQLLESKGYRFKTRTDTEVIIHLYEEYGTGLLDYLRGMFAFALWDRKRRCLMLARDRIGEKPLFYAYSPGKSLLFASELKSLLVDRELRVSLNYPALDQYFTFLFIPAPASIYKEINKLPPAHYLLCTEKGTSIHAYWDVPLPDAGEEDPLDEAALRERLGEAVRLQLQSDAPLGAFLSGGIDSTTIVNKMVEFLGRGVVTCSVGFPQDGDSDLSHARMVAGQLGTRHEAGLVESPTPEMIERIAWHFDEPFADSSAITAWKVSELARQRVKVTLSGGGGDELFGGYSRYSLERWEHSVRRLGRLASWTLSKLGAALRSGFGGRNRLAGFGLPPNQACAMKFQFGSRAEAFKNKIYSPLFRVEAMANGNPFEVFLQAFRRARDTDPVNRILYVDIKTSLADNMLVKMDRMSMAHGLEVRSPFLDHRLIELVARLPGRVKVSGAATKPLLRSILNAPVPTEASRRSRHGSTAPIGTWLRTSLRSYFEEMLFSPGSLAPLLFDRRGLRSLCQRHVSGRAQSDHELWMLLMLEVWHRGQGQACRLSTIAARSAQEEVRVASGGMR